MTVSKRFWKKVPLNRCKTICFSCRTYSSEHIPGRCYKCGSSQICETGRNFRAPRQSKVAEWKELHKMWLAQCKKNLARAAGKDVWGLTHFMGFGGHWYTGKDLKLPKSIRERAHLQDMKRKLQ